MRPDAFPMNKTPPAIVSPQAAPDSRLPSGLRALRHRNYRLFIGGQLISVIGTWMQNVAQAWLIYRLTDSAALLGLVGFAGQVPVFLISPLSGALADRCDRRRILLITQTVSMLLAFALAALTLAGVVREWHVFLLAVLLGITNAVDVPARQAFVVEIVGKADLNNAIALNSSTFNTARVFGPAIGGLLLASIGEGWCFFVNGVSYLPVIAGLLSMRLQPFARSAVPGSALAHMAEGFRYAARTTPIRALLLLLALISVMGVPYSVLMPIFADRVLHGGANALGLLMGAAGVGSLLGALTLAHRRSVLGLGNWVARAAAGFGAALILFSLSHWFWVSLLLLVPVGFCMIIEMASTNTLIQAMVPDHLRGRVMAIYVMMLLGMAPFGALLAGAVAQWLGAQATVALGGAICIAAAAVFRAYLPGLRGEARRLMEAAGG